MALFTLVDIETDDAGEIQVENGDLKLASPRRVAIQMLDFLLKSNFGEYTPEPIVCANFAEFMGDPNLPRTHNLMRQNAFEALRQQKVFQPGDVDLRIEAIDTDKAAVFARMLLQFSEEGDSIVLAYKFPFPDAAIEAVDLS